jgi:hypothetical protein
MCKIDQTADRAIEYNTREGRQRLITSKVKYISEPLKPVIHDLFDLRSPTEAAKQKEVPTFGRDLPLVPGIWH